jgi:hypothetical protein
VVDAELVESVPASDVGRRMVETTVLPGEMCDVCNAVALIEWKCKVICLNCHSIVRSCADL